MNLYNRIHQGGGGEFGKKLTGETLEKEKKAFHQI